MICPVVNHAGTKLLNNFAISPLAKLTKMGMESLIILCHLLSISHRLAQNWKSGGFGVLDGVMLREGALLGANLLYIFCCSKWWKSTGCSLRSNAMIILSKDTGFDSEFCPSWFNLGNGIGLGMSRRP